jgi:hypothetical protein
VLVFGVGYVARLFTFAKFLLVRRFYCQLIEAYRLVTADSIDPPDSRCFDYSPNYLLMAYQ